MLNIGSKQQICVGFIYSLAIDHQSLSRHDCHTPIHDWPGLNASYIFTALPWSSATMLSMYLVVNVVKTQAPFPGPILKRFLNHTKNLQKWDFRAYIFSTFFDKQDRFANCFKLCGTSPLVPPNFQGNSFQKNMVELGQD